MIKIIFKIQEINWSIDMIMKLKILYNMLINISILLQYTIKIKNNY